MKELILNKLFMKSFLFVAGAFCLISCGMSNDISEVDSTSSER